ncbi:tyrosine-type recombinase/integrase [Thalassomonas sp. M1454]|uniref:tyrosine-type recombinase/integrase n=1 Tax=Thalassomonas sp. M1454 TaxID=2594477 RepID=UPI001180B10A|nr:tyrosine-type recombinase/integrase [Thalassomonas sp. M1454]TRX53449.1 tyrosine-type recombinase/integrase [Thalassomonas sp. M1454]
MMNNPLPQNFTQCLEYYLINLLAKGYSQATVDLKQQILETFFDWLKIQAIFDLDRVNVSVLDTYLENLRSHRKKLSNLPLAQTTIRTRATTVKIFLRGLYTKGIIESNECEKFELPKAGKALPKSILSIQDVLAIIKQVPTHTIKGIRDRAIIECFYASGIRRNELVNLKLEDFDFSARQIKIVNGKGGHDRFVPIGKTAILWIRKYLRDARPYFAHIGSGHTLFLGNNGKKFLPGALTSLMSKYIKRANLNKFGSCHQYRHAAATHMMDNDADIRHVQEFLGHSSISTTQVYVHISKARLQKVYKKSHPRAD